jgi:spermidine/putrescine transport system permease protein
VSALDAGSDTSHAVAADSVVRPKRAVERLLAGTAWLVFAFLYLPILLLVVLSFNDNRLVGVWTEPSLRWYRALLADRAVLGALRNSIVVAVVSTAVSTVLGTAAALSM